MKVPNFRRFCTGERVSLSRLQNEGSQQSGDVDINTIKSIKATE